MKKTLITIFSIIAVLWLINLVWDLVFGQDLIGTIWNAFTGRINNMWNSATGDSDGLFSDATVSQVSQMNNDW